MADSEQNCASCDQEQPISAIPKESPTDPATFTAPTVLASPRVLIEFCNRCRWLHRAQWVATELFLTFPPPELASITVVPLTSDETAGRFRVWVFVGPSPALVWDRKVENGFPELKVLVEDFLPRLRWAQLTIKSGQKQRIRDKILPGKSLGHSDAGAH